MNDSVTRNFVNAGHAITGVDAWRLRVPLANPYHLSRVYGTLTHAEPVLLKITLADGSVGWGEADPGGLAFTGDTGEMVLTAARARCAECMGMSVEHWVAQGRGLRHHGSLAAAVDVACHDALARSRGIPVWQLLGERRRRRIDVLWPVSSGSAEDDLAMIDERAALGFRTFMLKMGERPVADDLERLGKVMAGLPQDVHVMVDANQGWTLDQALVFADRARALPLVLIEQPLAAADLVGLRQVGERARCPVSVDESLQTPQDAHAIMGAGAGDVFSIKVSKNGGLVNARAIAGLARGSGRRLLMNSMIELGITQAASLHLGCTLGNLLDCGHAYMSTLRMADDVTDFSSWISDGVAVLPERAGLGIEVDTDKIAHYQVGSCHVH